MGVEVRAFGPMEIWRAGTGVRVRSRLQQVLLAMLLIRRGGVASMPALAEAMWPVRRPANVETSIQIHVHRLRRTLGDAGTLQHQPPGYALGLPPVNVDLHRFEELAQRGRAALVGGDEAAAAELLRSAVALYRGPAFHGLDDVAELAIESRRLEELRLVALEDRIAAELALDRPAGPAAGLAAELPAELPADLAAELAALVAEHPLRERLRAQLMIALYRTGRKADALAAYRAGRQILVEELGVEPNRQSQALERAILADDPALLRPQTALPARVGGAGPPPIVPRQLPADVPGFTGRSRQLQELDAILQPDATQQPTGAGRPGTCVISAVAGMAGVGKTALALHWAHQVADRFPDGQLYVNLRGYDPRAPLVPGQALAWFLRALGVPAERVPADLDEAAGMYRSLLAERRVLVLLDNASSADQVRPLVPGGSRCVTLVTSRDRLAGLLARDGARQLALDVLSAGESRALLTRLLGADRVAAEPVAAEQLAQRCGRLPLALRIAAANLTARNRQPIADYLAGLRGRAQLAKLAELAVAGNDQEAVAAAFDLSYRRLPEPSRRVFRRLGLVPGPDFTADAVAALDGTAREPAQRQLAELAAAHLVQEHVPGRYLCHDLLRAYAHQQALAEEPPAARRAALARLNAYYRQAADAAAELLHPHALRLPRDPDPARPPTSGFPTPAAAVRWLDAELPNLVAAARHAVEGGDADRAYAWLLADALRSYLLQRGPLADAEALAAAGLAAAEASGQPRAYGCALLGRAGLHYRQGRGQEAIDDLTRALAAFREVGWVEGQASLLGNLGSVHLELGRLHDALDHHTEALALHERTGSRYGQAAILGNLAMQLQQLGRLREAADHGQRALTTLAGLGADQREATNLGNLAETRRLQGEFGAAQRLYTRAQARYQAVGDRNGQGRTRLGFAVIYGDIGQPEPARELALAALREVRDTGHRAYEAAALIGLAQIHRRSREHAAAARSGVQARDLAAEIGNGYLHAEALIELAILGPEAGPDGLARVSVDHALDLTRKQGYRLLEGQALAASAAIHLAAGELDRAVDEGGQALGIHEETGHRPGAAHTHALLGQARHQTGDTAAAEAHDERSRTLYAELGITPQA